jgi:hypothetical protein
VFTLADTSDVTNLNLRGQSSCCFSQNYAEFFIAQTDEIPHIKSMKIISIFAVLSALIGLISGTINWALGSLDRFENAWEEEWFETAQELSWLLTEWGIGFAVLLLTIGMAMQSFKANKAPSPKSK